MVSSSSVTKEEPRYVVIVSQYDPDEGAFKDVDATKGRIRTRITMVLLLEIDEHSRSRNV